MSILEKIILNKKKEIEISKSNISIKMIENSQFFENKIISLKKFLKEKSGVISEFKRKSPSKPSINLDAEISSTVLGYENANSSAISILTDNLFFGGNKDDILSVRKNISIPILRKDFIIDEYQILESKSMGADVILLIASCLSQTEVISLSSLSKSLGLETILEIHSKEELDLINDNIDVVGVNNRNLKLFKTDIRNSIYLSRYIPKGFMKISESGISSKNDIIKLKESGYDGFLIGENFMKKADPSLACKDFISLIR